jgi:hypothetical protein
VGRGSVSATLPESLAQEAEESMRKAFLTLDTPRKEAIGGTG